RDRPPVHGRRYTRYAQARSPSSPARSRNRGPSARSQGLRERAAGPSPASSGTSDRRLRNAPGRSSASDRDSTFPGFPSPAVLAESVEPCEEDEMADPIPSQFLDL